MKKFGASRLLGTVFPFLILASLATASDDRSEMVGTGRSLTLKESIQFATKQSPTFDSLRRQMEIATLQEKTAFARMLPSLDLNTTHGMRDENPRLAPYLWSSQFNLELTENLYDNGLSLTEYEISKLNKQKSELEFKNERNKLCLEIASEFMRFSLATKLLSIQLSQLKAVQDQFKVTSNYYHQGLKTRRDFLRFQTEVNRSEIDLIDARNSVEKSRQELLRLLGASHLSSSVMFVPMDLEQIENVDSKAAPKIERHFIYESSVVQKKVNDLQSDIVTRRYWPEVFLTAGATYQSSDYMGTNTSFSDNDRSDWRVLLTLKYNLWDWGIRSRDRQIALHQGAIGNNEQDSRVSNLRTEISNLMLNLEKLKKNFKLSKELLSLEEKNLAMIQRDYRNGQVSYLDLILGLSNLSDAQRKFYSSLSSLQEASFSYDYHQGTLYDVITK